MTARITKDVPKSTERHAGVRSAGSRRQREIEAQAFLYRKHGNGTRQRWSDGKIEVAKYINPYSPKSVWTYDDIDLVFDQAAEKIIRQHAAGQLKYGLTASYAKTALRNTAIDFWRKYAAERGDRISLSAPIEPNPKRNATDVAATVEGSLAGPRHDEPEQLLLRGLLAATLDQVIAELPERQLRAVRLRELIDYDVRSVSHDLISEILDLTYEISFSAHTSAFDETKRSIKRKLADKLGHPQLAELLAELDIDLDLGHASRQTKS